MIDPTVARTPVTALREVTLERHLISPHRKDDGPVDAGAYLADLRAAHDAIAKRAVAWTSTDLVPSWGTVAKRSSVDLTDAHPLVSQPRHSIVGLINACATVERLLDALAWAINEGWAEEVIECNPTTSSGIMDPPDLQTIGRLGEARFEVSDVVSRRDGTGKLRKDLDRLRGAPPSVAKFLVASPEWEGRIAQRFEEYWRVPTHHTIVAYVESVSPSGM